MRVKKIPLSVLVISLFTCSSAAVRPAYSADCKCGPDYCLDTPQYTQAFAVKRAALSAAYPLRLVAILSKVDHCVACVRDGPDGFSIMRVEKNGGISVDGWKAENEHNDATAVTSGALSACYVLFQRRVTAACLQPPYDQRADYDATIDLNRDMAISCQP